MPRSTATARGVLVRRKLLAAAAELVPEVGWHAVSTRNLAEQAGVGPGLVHYHFSSVQALLRAATLGEMREVLAEVAPTLEGVDPLHGIDLMLQRLDAYTGHDPTSVLFTEAVLAATRDEELRAELTGILTDFRAALAAWLEEYGYAEPEATAAVLAAAIDGVLLHRSLNSGLTSTTVAPALRKLLTPIEDEGE